MVVNSVSRSDTTTEVEQAAEAFSTSNWNHVESPPFDAISRGLQLPVHIHKRGIIDCEPACFMSTAVFSPGWFALARPAIR